MHAILLSLFLLLSSTTTTTTTTAATTVTTTTTTVAAATSSQQSHSLSLFESSKPHQVFELTQPLPSDYLPPSCTHTILHHTFSTATDDDGPPPFTTPYSPPPDCPYPWSFVSLEFRATCNGGGDYRRHRIAAVWLAGSELLRTSAAEPNGCGFFWKFRKEVTKYSCLLVKKNLNLTMLLENAAVDNNGRTGTYNVEIKLLFYKDYGVRARPLTERNGLDETTPHSIIPISAEDNNNEKGFWFKVESELDLKVKRIKIPRNTQRAVVELYASSHQNDEFWYGNPPNSYLIMNNLTDVGGNGAFREVFVTIDGELVGSEMPFPVIFNGGFNPLFWEPIVAIGAFHIPCYEFDITPFLGKVLDGKVHEFGIGVNDAASYWFMDANLHLWFDPGSTSVTAGIQPSLINPSLSVKRRENFRLLDGYFTIKAKRKSQFMGWVKSSFGNLTTVVSQDFKFRNLIRFENNGNHKVVKQTVTMTKRVKVKLGSGDTMISNIVVRRRYPLDVVISTLPRYRTTVLMLTNVTHGLTERYSDGDSTSVLLNNQDSRGWLDAVRRNGEAITKQSLSYRDVHKCYSRSVLANNGELVSDNSSFSCPTVYVT